MFAPYTHATHHPSLNTIGCGYLLPSEFGGLVCSNTLASECSTRVALKPHGGNCYSLNPTCLLQKQETF
jgi:hypothetical protein